MEDMTAILFLALLGGMADAVVRLPPLMGFLVAGFVLNVAGVESVPALDVVADLGVTLLLFGVVVCLRRTLIHTTGAMLRASQIQHPFSHGSLTRINVRDDADIS